MNSQMNFVFIQQYFVQVFSPNVWGAFPKARYCWYYISYSEGDHRLHVIEVPFRLRGAHRKGIMLRHISQIHNSHLFSGRATLAIFQTLVYALHFIHLTDLQNSGFTIFCVQGELIAASSLLLVPQLFCRMVGILTLKSTPFFWS